MLEYLDRHVYGNHHNVESTNKLLVLSKWISELWAYIRDRIISSGKAGTSDNLFGHLKVKHCYDTAVMAYNSLNYSYGVHNNLTLI